MSKKTLSRVLQELKKLNIPRENLISIEGLEKVTAEKQHKY